MSDEGKVAIDNGRGQTKLYETVASRRARFRTDNPNWTIKTEILAITEEYVRMRAEIGYYAVKEDGGQYILVATGHAEEWYGAGEINATSALENCETSAVGRALANAGYASADSNASADEIQSAQRKQAAIEDVKKPGLIAWLQEQAKQGEAALSSAWKNLEKVERQALAKELPKLKRIAMESDREIASHKKEYEKQTG